MSFLTKAILNLPPPFALAMIFLLPALEASVFLGFIFPGETSVILGGVLAYEHKFPLWLVMTVASLGAVLGDSVGYFVGKKKRKQKRQKRKK
jgi:membrane-associated protein